MATANSPYPEAGQAAFEVLDDYTAKLLISGSWPALGPGVPLTVKADEELDQFMVVGFDDNGDLVPATATGTDDVAPIGIVTQAVTGNAGGTTTVPVFRSGCFNPDALVWDASFSDAEKLVAFEAAPSPTTILIRERG